MAQEQRNGKLNGMNKIKLFVASSLDGYIARTDGSVDWLFIDNDYGYSSFYESVGVVVMGRKTYEQVLTFGDYPYRGKEGIVLSHSKAGQSDAHVRFMAGSLSDLVAELRGLSGQDIWLVGGAELTKDFLAAQLVDELILSIHPVLLGSGISLFVAQQVEQPLALVSCQPFDSGLVQLHYRRS